MSTDNYTDVSTARQQATAAGYKVAKHGKYWVFWLAGSFASMRRATRQQYNSELAAWTAALIEVEYRGLS